MTLAQEAPASERAPKPMFEEPRGVTAQVSVYLFVILPTLALVAAVPLAWGWGLGWVDVALFVAFYAISGLGVTVGYHRHFTHGSFKAKRALRVALAVAGSTAVQGSVVDWVADHRRHHAYSDKEGDPHSPWLFGSSPWALTKGFWHAHMGWLFERESTNKERFAPDLVADRDIVAVDRLFVLWTALSLLLPGVLGGLITWTWWGALTGFFWAGLVRVAALHHITWSVNSICHMIGERPFASRDKAANFWPLAIVSFGEAWHNLHHADPTCARHGVLRGQIDISARTIWLFEKFGWVWNVRWPTPQRLARISAK
ncbi:acyl-CoA desaturase [Streptoalloteichus hindustanus]|uniref:Stearoyl-CoA desaturase (Delta-9 desaturase) n=1 Tax=Streptoalloteichus hindustanus TaxID=2017 RepID=A0A1M5KUI9_STRHI|nr:acyl-CoA desaturase [Streptoalloteichus hindustanus]SHG56464.1 stearoyl-CoA desaturase (delta-9 desaturase) [Streptoalloteichus hindustanus]